jgi:tellurite resistance protein
MTTAANPVPNPAAHRSLAYLPVGAFAMVMGLSGLAIAWRSAGSLWGFGPVVGRSLAVLALVVFAVVGVGYAVKALRHTAGLKAEWTHPVKVAFTATIPVSLLVLAAAFQGWLPLLASVLWWVGAVGQFGITLWVVRTWIADAAIQQVHIHPAWFIPAVGNIIAPVAGVELAPAAFSWYFFGVGAVYYVGLLPIVLSRLFTAGTLPPALAPTLAILIAPPSVASLAWVRMGGSWDDPIVKILLGVAVFQTILLLVQAPALRSIPFAMSSWAYSFPLAAVTSALIGSTLNGGLRYDWLAMTLLVLTTVAISVLFGLTVRAVAKGQICRPE